MEVLTILLLYVFKSMYSTFLSCSLNVALYVTDCCVVFQGDIVNNIEQNVSKSVDHITVAKEQTKKAVRYQTKARKVMQFSQLPHQSACDLFLFFSAYFLDTLHFFQWLTHSNHPVRIQITSPRPADTLPVTLNSCILGFLLLSLSLLLFFSFIFFCRFSSPLTQCPTLGWND